MRKMKFPKVSENNKINWSGKCINSYSLSVQKNPISILNLILRWLGQSKKDLWISSPKKTPSTPSQSTLNYPNNLSVCHIKPTPLSFLRHWKSIPSLFPPLNLTMNLPPLITLKPKSKKVVKKRRKRFFLLPLSLGILRRMTWEDLQMLVNFLYPCMGGKVKARCVRYEVNWRRRAKLFFMILLF